MNILSPKIYIDNKYDMINIVCLGYYPEDNQKVLYTVAKRIEDFLDMCLWIKNNLKQNPILDDNILDWLLDEIKKNPSLPEKFREYGL